MIEVKTGVRQILLNCLGIKNNEQVLIVTDTGHKELGKIFWQESLQLGSEAVMMIMNPREISGQEPPLMVVKAMEEAQVSFLVTSRSLTHTQARRNATKRGARIASIPGLSLEAAVRVFQADYQTIAQRSMAVAEILTRGEKVRITSRQGTDLSFSIQGRMGGGDTGLYNIPGDYGNLPAGEASIGPVEGTAQGVLVVDGSMSTMGLLKEPIILKIRDGYVVEIEGGEEAKHLEEALQPYGKAGRNIAELGIGTNDRAQIHGLIVEDEKTLGTIHIGLGNNTIFGGKVEVPVHLDAVLRQPTLQIDGETIIEKGKLLVGELVKA